MIIKKNLAIFDMDGTLYDTNMVNYLSYKDALPYNVDFFTYDFFSKECNGKSYKFFLPVILNTTDNDIIKEVHFRKKLKYKNYLNMSIENKHLFNIICFLKKEYNIALCTTASKENVLDILNYYGRTNLFDLVLTHEDVLIHKPNPEIFFKAMKYFEKNKNETIIFEDSKDGIEAAKKTGASVIIVDSFNI